MKIRIFSLLVLMLLFLSSMAQKNQAVLTFLMGEVMVQIPGQPQKVARWNMPLPVGTLIMTGDESMAEITLPDKSVIRLTERSQFRLSEVNVQRNNRSFLFELLQGGFFSKIIKAVSGKVGIKSPTALIAVRGTEFGVWAVNDSTDEISVLEGTVEVFDALQTSSVMVSQEQKLSVTKGRPLPAPTPLSPLEKSYLRSLSEGFKPAVPTVPEQQKETEDGKTPVAPEQKDEAYRPVTPVSPQPQPEGGSPLQMGGGIGAVTMDGQTYTQLAFRPELKLGKLGIVFDIALYMDQNGKIRREDWDEVSDFIEKIYYVKWAERGDPFYAKVGAIDYYTLGFGLLMNRYSNTVEYPTVRRTGVELGFRKGKWYLEGMVNNVKELTNSGGMVALRTSYQLPFRLEIGGMLVHDINQYAALADIDGDGVPDLLDDFPRDKNYSVDSDGDGVPDTMDPDVDGDGYTDNSQDPNIQNNDPDGISYQKPEPFNIRNKRNSVTGWGLSLSYPLVRSKMFSLIPYSEIAGIAGYGYGISAPGVMGNIAFLQYKAEYRTIQKEFIPEYFNQTYELDRVRMVQDTTGALIPLTRKETLKDVKERMSGVLAGAGFQLFHMLNFYAEYQNMKQADRKYNSLRAEATLNTAFIPKIKQASAYYNQYNVKKLFSPSDGTILGYRLMYEISAGAYFMLDYRQTYRDLNGDGKYRGSDEISKTFNVGTYFNF